MQDSMFALYGHKVISARRLLKYSLGALVTGCRDPLPFVVVTAKP
jgi:hypothetical protein